jgi:hypothetical protein
VYTLTLTNVGETTDTYTLAGSFPAGVTASFSQTTIMVPPGQSNFRDIQLTLTPAPGTAIGSDSFTVTATSTTQSSVMATASGALNVLSSGVHVSIDPQSAAPGSTLQMTVTNTGLVTDTFDLSLAAPSALVATLGTTQVTLAAGASQVVPITTSSVDFAVPGPLSLMGIATSHSQPQVRNAATAALSIPETQGLTGSFTPSVQQLPGPGPASFLLTIKNTGNTEDAYAVSIDGTDGPVTGSLNGLDGQPTQSIPVVRLPGLSTGAVLVQTNLASQGQGTVKVQVKSLNHSTSTEAVATVSAASTPVVPPTPEPPPSPPASGPGGASPLHFFVTGVDAGAGPHVKVFRLDGTLVGSFFAFGPGFRGGVHVAVGDVNGDGVPDIIVGAGAGPHVLVIDGTKLNEVLPNGQIAPSALLASFLAFGPSFQGGVSVAAGDVNGDGRADIIVGAGPGAGPHVEVIDATHLNEVLPNGQIAPAALLGSFFGFGPGFHGGVTVAAGDVNGDGRADIIVGAGPGAGPHLLVIDSTRMTQVLPNGQIAGAALLASFFAYGVGFRGGLAVGAADLSGDGRADVLTGAGPGAGPHVLAIDATRMTEVLPDGQIAPSALLASFFAFEPTLHTGVTVAGADLDGDGHADLLAGAGPGGLSRVRPFLSHSPISDDFFAYLGSNQGLFLGAG